MHIRNYNFKKTLLSDPTALKGWQDVFDASSREEVDTELKKQGIDHSWGPDNSLRIVNKLEAVEKHPQTGDKIWFNHLMVSVCMYVCVCVSVCVHVCVCTCEQLVCGMCAYLCVCGRLGQLIWDKLQTQYCDNLFLHHTGVPLVHGVPGVL